MSTPGGNGGGKDDKGSTGPNGVRDSSDGAAVLLPHDRTFDTADTHDDDDYQPHLAPSHATDRATSRSLPQEGPEGGSRRVSFRSSVGDKDEGIDDDSELPTRSPNRQLSSSPSIRSGGSSSSDPEAAGRRKPSSRRRALGCLSDDERRLLVLQAMYIAVFGVFGSVLRVYLGRFFGLDCQNAVSDDWFTRISEAVCVTTNGKTDQTGGALFTDLPANMVGCFVMGVLCPAVLLRGSIHPVAWFRRDHPLQRHPAFLLALKVGFCGCLTTFASWNTQMVVMLDGSDTVLGPQVAAALAGYLVGMCTSIASFLCGRHAYEGWVSLHAPRLPQPDSADAGVAVVAGGVDDAMERGDRDGDEGGTGDHSSDALGKENLSSLLSPLGRLWGAVAGIRVMPFLLLAGMTAGFVVGDAIYDNLFYRKMWMCVVLSPCGALLRWHLSRYNPATPAGGGGSGGGGSSRWDWVPWGTVAANMGAVVVSVLAEALEDRYAVPGAPGYAWISTALPAVETGFAGSLSTVSTFVREIVDLHSTPTRMYLYGFGSLSFAMLLGLLVYSPVIRYL